MLGAISIKKERGDYEGSDYEQSCDLEASIIHKIKMNKVIQNFETKNYTKNQKSFAQKQKLSIHDTKNRNNHDL